MPVYEFYCRDCKKDFVLVHSITEHEHTSARCPTCNGTNVDRKWTEVYAVTSKKS
ncbi:MAG TPA: FmdB family zinc ribbon protein [Vicinamibacterales bacterium]|nr:FmdB family zinc ribbon protein [Vicinamibacterales bacterium]